MFSFQLSAEQQEFRDTVKDFVKREVKPVANHPDRLQAEDPHFVPAILEQASQMGLRTLALSEDLGGAGADYLTSCVLAEELAAGDIGFAATLARTSELGHVLFDQAMSEAQRQQFLSKFLEDDHFHLAYAGSDIECDDGGWNYHRAEKSEVEVPVVATKQGDDLVLNGTYAFVANAPLAKLIAVQVKTDAQAVGLAGVQIVLVPAETVFDCLPGGEIGHTWVHFSLPITSPKVTAPVVVTLPPHGKLLAREVQARARSKRGDAQLNHTVLAWLHALWGCAELGGQAPASPRLERALAMIGARLASPPAVGELAQACGMSAGAFIRWFKAETGTTPSEVMTQRRVTEASRLLRYTDLSVEQVAAKLGYANRYHFSRVFARVAGCGPATFRRGAGA